MTKKEMAKIMLGEYQDKLVRTEINFGYISRQALASPNTKLDSMARQLAAEIDGIKKFIEYLKDFIEFLREQ